MNKKIEKIKDTKSNQKLDDISLKNKVIEKSLDSKIDFDLIDNSNAYYSERYGWTLRKN